LQDRRVVLLAQQKRVIEQQNLQQEQQVLMSFSFNGGKRSLFFNVMITQGPRLLSANNETSALNDADQLGMVGRSVTLLSPANESSIVDELALLRRHYREQGGNSAAILLQIQQMEELLAGQQQQQQMQQIQQAQLLQHQQMQQQQQQQQMQQQMQMQQLQQSPASLLSENDRDRQIRVLDQEVQLLKRKMELDTMLQSIQQQQMQLQRAWPGDPFAPLVRAMAGVTLGGRVFFRQLTVCYDKAFWRSEWVWHDSIASAKYGAQQ
jgi:hypothetical protein